VVKSAIKHQENFILVRTHFASQTKEEAEQLLKETIKESNDLFVLSLWANFERFVRDYLQKKGKKLQEISPPTLASSFYQHLYKELEYWKANDILNILKGLLTDKNLIGQAKQILEYRDWIAHGRNPDKYPSANITPKFAYNTLSEIVKQLLLN